MINFEKSPVPEEKKETIEERATRLHEAIKDDKHIRGIVAALVLEDFDRRDKIGVVQIGQFLQKYKNPADLAPDAERFLTEIEAQNNPQKREEYEKALDTLLNLFYSR